MHQPSPLLCCCTRFVAVAKQSQYHLAEYAPIEELKNRVVFDDEIS